MSISGRALTISASQTASIKVTGDIASTDTCYATKDGVQKNAVWTSVPNPAYHNLPSGYTEVEYLQGDGNCYFDTGYKHTTNDGTVEVDISLPTSATGVSFYGAYDDNASSRSFIFYKINNTFYPQVCNVDSYTASTNENRHKYKITAANGTATGYIDDTQVATYSYSGTIAKSFNDYLLAINRLYGGGASALAVSGTKLYGCNILSGNTLVKQFVTCKRDSDNAYGIYDVLDNNPSTAFHANAGTGTFTAGSEVPQYLYYWLIKKISQMGTWTVHWSDGSRVTERDVLIDALTEYTVENIERLYLYNEGDECTSVTGGWIKDGYKWASYDNGGNLVKNTDNMVLYRYTTNIPIFGTVNPINLNNYTKWITHGKSSIDGNCVAGSDVSKLTSTSTRTLYISLYTSDSYYEADISAKTTSEYLFYGMTSYEGDATFYEMWLE